MGYSKKTTEARRERVIEMGAVIGVLVGLVLNWCSGNPAPFVLVAVVSATLGFVVEYIVPNDA